MELFLRHRTSILFISVQISYCLNTLWVVFIAFSSGFNDTFSKLYPFYVQQNQSSTLKQIWPQGLFIQNFSEKQLFRAGSILHKLLSKIVYYKMKRCQEPSCHTSFHLAFFFCRNDKILNSGLLEGYSIFRCEREWESF